MIVRRIIFACALIALSLPTFAQSNADFDFHIGTWKTHVKRLKGTTWVEFDGITVVRKVWDGRANLVELTGDGFEGLSLRLYNPQSKQWSLHFASSHDGIMNVPTIGQFKNGRGEFYAQEMIGGRATFVRFIITPLTPDAIRFEQAFSDDGGKTWDVNWIATDTRVATEETRTKP